MATQAAVHQPWAASITFSKSTESHAGTVIHGTKAREGYTSDDLNAAKDIAAEAGYEAEIVNLHEACDTSVRSAYVLVVRGACRLLADDVDLADVQREYRSVIWPNLDRHLVSYGKVLTKHARGNAELGPEDIASNYADFSPGERVAGRPVSGRVIAFSRVPLHAALARGWERILGPKGANLRAELNHYGPSHPSGGVEDKNPSHTFARTGIGFHGDSERPDVACLCIGNETKELHFQAFKGSEPVGERCVLTLHPGDAYVMCETACGFRWKTELRSARIVHYRHAAGAPGSTKWTPTVDAIRAASAKKLAAKRKRKQFEEEHDLS